MIPIVLLLAGMATIGPQASRASSPEVRETVRGDLGKEVDEILSRLEKLGFCGIALVAKGGEVLLAKGYGASDREKGTPVTLDTVFCLGSVTKQFTGAAILKLESEGKLAVSDPISNYLPGVPPDKAAITVHHLLTHSSGLAPDFAGDYDPVGREEYVRRALASDLLSAPGERYAYSNAGYSLLGAIVELRSGKSYERYVRETLFEPAGMLRTGYKIPSYGPGEVAIGYRGGERWGTVLERPMAEDGPWWALRANGGIHTTVGDFWRWHRALQRNSILPEEARKRIFTPHVPEDPEGSSHYGYGWVVARTRSGKKVVTHSGGNGIFSADFRHFVDDDVAGFLASSVAEMPANAIARIWRPVLG
ncbi:MAG: serine hydrolase domain-containing protein, partial [Planctomycetota bacterium]